jgi:hypothetical protein
MFLASSNLINTTESARPIPEKNIAKNKPTSYTRGRVSFNVCSEI